MNYRIYPTTRRNHSNNEMMCILCRAYAQNGGAMIAHTTLTVTREYIKNMAQVNLVAFRHKMMSLRLVSV